MYMCFFHAAPIPTVTVSVSRSGVLYAGTTFALSCDVALEHSVGSSVTVHAIWLGPGGEEISDGDSRFATVSPTMVTPGPSDYQLHQGRLMINPLSTADTGAYTCRVVIRSTSLITEGDPGMGNINITITGIEN